MREKFNALRPFFQSVLFQCAFGLIVMLIALGLGILTKSEWPFLLMLLPMATAALMFKR